MTLFLAMQVPLYTLSRQAVESSEVPERIFARKWNADLVHQVLVAQEANSRSSLAHTKNRAEVRGGGRKPWRQKGTGRARHGSIRSPLWRGGGVTFGPRTEQVFAKKVNKKMRQAALFAVLSQKLRAGELFVLPDDEVRAAKTKELAQALRTFVSAAGGVLPRTLIVTPEKNRALERASQNLARVAVLRADSLNVRDLLAARWILVLRSSIPVIDTTYANV